MFNNFLEVERYFNNRKLLGIKPGLDRINTLLQLLQHPENKTKSIHVAGTNGKGSTIHYIKNALIQNNYKVGVFVSPSPNGLTNYMFINDSPIDEQTFVELLNVMYPVISILDERNNHPTEFEIITVLAFLYFAESVDFALIETGMGGREDTTNCFLPLLSIITNVSRDHMAFLGDSVHKIAYHKAGIIKYKTPAIVGPMPDEAMHVIEREASSVHANLVRYGQDFQTHGTYYTHFSWKYRLYNILNINLQMVGRHQQVNAAVAIMAIVKLIELEHFIDLDLAIKGIEKTQVPGRFELVHRKPQIIVDGAHNEAGIQSFIDTVKTVDDDTRFKHVIFAAYRDKDIPAMLKLLQGQFETITLTTFDHPRAATISELSNYVNEENVFAIEDWQKNIETVLNSSRSATDYYITGSLDFITKVKSMIAKE
ncbi:bifunctional folylpolyglutamate synthase/dihydrofolate synthase [Virgibacillus necropolis]|uniref:tetrahydrofolate synthase n=1 Tax=Virgibacillus necropolis TaxID=163877 RepID=A0A221MBU4_9BACI|nr:folylpolyglutamate synthase/dihydrofolate synthase family protein [Virgibacillus necropolis]ASN05097.1 bifunctional folylpolyglutamate synthase/dihydrofolate synthase [Virgibacillus necropolis]